MLDKATSPTVSNNLPALALSHRPLVFAFAEPRTTKPLRTERAGRSSNPNLVWKRISELHAKRFLKAD
jgi:hypothetical protein